MTDTRCPAGSEAERPEVEHDPTACRRSGGLKWLKRPQMRGGLSGLRRGITMSKSAKDMALSLLFEDGVEVQDVKFFKGDSPSVTEEEFWGEVRSALMQERMGTATVSTTFPDPAKPIDAVAFLESL